MALDEVFINQLTTRKHIGHLSTPLALSSAHVEDVLCGFWNGAAEERILLGGIEKGIDDMTCVKRFKLYMRVRI